MQLLLRKSTLNIQATSVMNMEFQIKLDQKFPNSNWELIRHTSTFSNLTMSICYLPLIWLVSLNLTVNFDHIDIIKIINATHIF